MTQWERKWTDKINAALEYALTEDQEDAVAKILRDLRWEVVEEAAAICEDNGDENSADDITQNLQDV